MSQLNALHDRIAAAMARIEAATTHVAQGASAARQADAAMAAALEEERLANAQLSERLRGLKERHDAEIDALKNRHATDLEAAIAQSGEGARTLQAELAAQAQALSQLDLDVQRLRIANQQLRDSNAALREANAAGVGEPHLINSAMLAELEGLRAVREAELAEAGAVLARLEPLLADAAQADERESA
jgi:hypothetical protein